MQDHDGLRRMRAEMARQCADALATFPDVAQAAAAAARGIAASGAVTLVAMGGSHHVNAIAAPLYRALGLDAQAWVASDLLLAPPPEAPRAFLVASQSGRSGEIVQWLSQDETKTGRFSLTLDAASPLAAACEAALVAHGGPEQAFAATRSIILTLAMHGAIMEALGSGQGALRAVLARDAPPPVEAAEDVLKGCDAVVFAGYGAMAGVAASAALSMMELARLPTIGFEGGQFRHGPFEMLRSGVGVVLFRGADAGAARVPALAAAAAEAGCATILMDSSGEPPAPHGLTVALAPNAGLAAAAAMLLALQPLAIALARRRIAEGVGTPLRTSKVTV